MKNIYWVLTTVIATTSLGIQLYNWHENQNISESTVSSNKNDSAISSKHLLSVEKPEVKPYALKDTNSTTLSAISQTSEKNSQLKGYFTQTASLSIAEQNEREAKKIEDALKNPDPNVRFKTLLQFHNNSEVFTLDTFANLIQNDNSESIRLAALRLIISSPENNTEKLKEILELALSDSNETIRTQAHDFLTQIDESALLASGNTQSDPQKN